MPEPAPVGRRPGRPPASGSGGPQAPSGPPLVGLTGGIGAGKSAALAALAELGAATLSTDRVVHELYESPELVALVRDRWGDGVAPGGVVDRAAIARAAFRTDEDRAWLEGELWPRVAERVAAFIRDRSAAVPPPRAVVVETPLLFEAGMEGIYDATVAVVTDERVRAQRAGARGHAAVDERTARQLSQDEKAARATHVVRNDGSLADLRARLSDLLVTLDGT